MFNKKQLEIEQQRPKSILPLIIALANKILSVIGFEEYVNNLVEWDNKQCKVSSGALAKAVILATFFEVRAPLSKINERFELIDTELLFGTGIKPMHLTDDSIGRTLDKIAKADKGSLWHRVRNVSLKIFYF